METQAEHWEVQLQKYFKINWMIEIKQNLANEHKTILETQAKDQTYFDNNYVGT